jgi:hypothetical protein
VQAAGAQYLKKPNVATPSLKIVRPVKYYKGSASPMGLFDFSASAGYINKTAMVYNPSATATELPSSGQFLMVHLQEGVLSNYFLAKKYKRDKKLKFGLQNTVDLGIRRGAAVTATSDYATPTTSEGGAMKFFLNYQFGLAAVLKLGKIADIGYTYYPYVNSIFCPETRSYSKARFRCSRVMLEYSFNGQNSIELKYLRAGKAYIGLSYTNNDRKYQSMTYPYVSSDVNTQWYQLTIGKVF